MSDTTPSEPEGGGTGRGSGPRRSGLDRLRAARGDAPAPASTAAATAGPSEAGDDGGSRAGSTALLDTPSSTPELDDVEQTEALDAGALDGGIDERNVAEGDTAEADTEPDSAVGGRAGRRGRRGRTRTASAVDDDELAKAAEDDEAAPGRRKLRRRGATAATTTTATKPAGRAARRPTSRRQALLAAALALLVIALAIPVVGMRHRLIGETKSEKETKQLVAKRDAGLVAGRQFAVTFFTFDYRKIDDFVREVQAQTVGDFNRDFTNRSAELKATLQQIQSVASARVLSAGVSKVSGDNVEVLIVANQDIKNKASKGKTVVQRYRLAVVVQGTPRGWLVNDVKTTGF